MPEYQLGRLPHTDARDTNFPMRMQFARATVLPASKLWRGPLPRLDQGSVGACVGFTGENWRGTLPLYSSVTNDKALYWYNECKKIDHWGPSVEGTNDHYLAQVLVQHGLIERYLWAQTPAELEEWVLTVGPAMVGTNWYDGMFDPGRYPTVRAPDNGLILKPSGTVVGGHEWLVRGLRTYRGRKWYRMRNSWGGSWGEWGEAWIEDVDLYRLVFGEGGDALGAVEKRP